MVTSGDCTVVGYCVQSPNYPAKYGNSEFCDIAVNPDGAEPILVVDFKTEIDYDVLTVNGEKYSGTTGPEGVTPTGVITWASDYSIRGTGWQLCPTGNTTTTTITSTTITSSTATTPTITITTTIISTTAVEAQDRQKPSLAGVNASVSFEADRAAEGQAEELVEEAEEIEDFADEAQNASASHRRTGAIEEELSAAGLRRVTCGALLLAGASAAGASAA